MTLFARLSDAAGADWQAYVAHQFVRQLAAGTLPLPAFRHYLVQDYLFLIHFARAHALAVVKSDSLLEMRSRAATVDALLNTELGLHVGFCADWGIDEAAIQATPEAQQTMAYTRYVLERGLAGDVLDLEVALAPCTVGYAEVARLIMADPARMASGNPYQRWIDMYASADYQAVAQESIDRLDRIGTARGAEARFPVLAKTFAEASRLEAGFWQMGLDAA